MKVCEKIRIMRKLKSFSQEEMAEKLGLSLDRYVNIERGATDTTISKKLEQIAEIFDTDLMELLSFGEKSVVCLTGGKNHTYNVGMVTHTANTSVDFKNEFEKSQLIIEALHSEIAYLKEIIELMKNAQAN